MRQAELTVGSLFSGIGGLDLGLERAGMRVIWQCETDKYASKVLKKHWPHVPNLGDVKRIDWSNVRRPDLICGGYPCQPFSLAGGRGGVDDARHLWPHFAAALRVLRPRWALLENVPGHLSLGFNTVLGDLAELGYDAEWESLPAAAFGAPHLRYRIFVVAYRDGEQLRVRPGGGQTVADAASDPRWLGNRNGETDVSDAASKGLERSGGESDPTWATFSESPRGNKGGDWWVIEPDVGRVADGVPHRVDRLRCLGNAVVPQVAEWVGRCIVNAGG